MDLNQIKQNYVFTVRIELDDENFIELREPTILEIKGFGENGEQNLETMQKIFPACVIGSSFTNGENPATGKEIYDQLKLSSSLLTQILETWVKQIPFQSRIRKTGK